MTTIKDIARRAGVSGTTVSIILNGKSEERHISPATKERVLAICNELNYHPNLSARRLRFQEDARPVIAFYWPLDQRASILASFLICVQEITSSRHFDCEVAIRTYKNDHIQDSVSTLLKNSYTGALIGALSQNDLTYLETLDIQTPVVLINRKSEKFSTVTIDPDVVGMRLADLFRQKGYKKVSAFITKRTYIGYGQRTKAFFDACAKTGITIEPKYTLYGENSLSGGVAAAREYCSLEDAPKAIYCESDYLALGALNELQRQGRRIPEDNELLCIGMMNPEFTEYSTPSISTIEMDNTQVVAKSVDILIDAIQNTDFTPRHVVIDPVVNLRSSFQPH